MRSVPQLAQPEARSAQRRPSARDRMLRGPICAAHCGTREGACKPVALFDTEAADSFRAEVVGARMKTVLSGIQPSGRPHLGNYFGAIRQHIALQDGANECFFFIADYHALTTSREPEKLREAVHDVAVTYLALGLDPARVALFRQSDIKEVTEL